MSDKPILGASALLLGGLALAFARLGAWLTIEEGPMLAGVFDGAYFLSAGAVAAALAVAAGRLSRGRSMLPWLALGAGSLAFGYVFLRGDFGGFAGRQRLLPSEVAFFFLAVVVSSLVPLGCWVGRQLTSLKWRVAATVVCGTAVLVNGVVLNNDYRGVHLFVAMIALCSLGAAWWSFRPQMVVDQKSKTVLAAFGLAAVAGASLTPPPARVTAPLGNSTGAAFTPLFTRLPHLNAAIHRTWDGDEWYRPRNALPPIPPSAKRLIDTPPLIIMLTIDALRADVVNSGKHDKLLPTLARLREEGVHFTQARSPGTLTRISLASVFMGVHFSQQYWSEVPNRNGELTPFADMTPRFPTLLKDAGVHTVNFFTVHALTNGDVVAGFEVDRHITGAKTPYAPATRMFQDVLPHVESLLQQEEKHAFVYSHLIDAHDPYDGGALKEGPPFQRYLSEVAVVDSQLARLVELIESSEHRSRVLLILSADHGEAFGEHNSKYHGSTMYEEVLHVPLIMWRPEGLAARHLSTLVSLIDIGPTILDLFGLATPGRYMGQSLVPFLHGETPTLTRPIVAETRRMRTMVTEDGLKLVVEVGTNRRELYDLKVDPNEEHNLAGDTQLLDVPFRKLQTFFNVHTVKREGYTPPFIK